MKQLEVVVANANMKFASLEDTMSVLTKELSHIKKKGTGRRVKFKAGGMDEMEEIVRLHSLSGQEKMSGGQRVGGRTQSAWFPTTDESSDFDESDSEKDGDEAGSAGPASAARQKL